MNENYFEQLQAVCKARGYRLEKKVRTGNAEHILFKVILNPQSNHGTLCITAGIHGNEVSGPWAVLDFLKKYRSRPSDPRIIILPVLNPHGFLHDRRGNYSRFNLNRHFGEKPLPLETKIITGLLKKEKMDFFISLHEDDEKKGFYLYQYGKDNPLIGEITAFLSQNATLCKERDIYGDTAEKGVIFQPKWDGSLEEWIYKRGRVNSVCLEIPDQLALKDRVAIVQRLLLKITRSAGL